VLLGIDVGITSVKALLVDPSGRRRYLSQRSLRLIFPGGERVEQDPLQMWDATLSAVSEVLSRARHDGDGEVTSISLSSQGGTLIPLDESAEPLGRAIVWMDHRPREQSRELRRRFGEDFLYEKTGWTPTGCLPLLQIRWLRRNRPSLFERMRGFSFVGDFITRRLCGEWIADPSSAGITMLYNIREGDWDAEILELAGVGTDQLPRVIPSGVAAGELLPDLRRQLGIASGSVTVANGGHDQYCASLGAGTISEGDLLLSGGTAWVLLLTTEHAVFDRRTRLAPGRHVVTGKWGLMSSVPAGGGSVDWLRRNLGSGGSPEDFYMSMEGKIRDVPPGSEGLMFLPHLVEASAPARTSPLMGSILGLELRHGPHHIFRALLEGVAYEALWNVEVFRELGANVDSVTMIGGATRSRIWPRLVSDVLDMPVRVPEIQEAGCVGAAILAGMADGSFVGCEEGVGRLLVLARTFAPDETVSEAYRDIFRSYKEASRTLGILGSSKEGGDVRR